MHSKKLSVLISKDESNYEILNSIMLEYLLLALYIGSRWILYDLLESRSLNAHMETINIFLSKTIT